MLTITRRIGETVEIYPAEGTDPNLTVGELFADQPIVVQLGPLGGGRARLSITAPRALQIWRGSGLPDMPEDASGAGSDAGFTSIDTLRLRRA